MVKTIVELKNVSKIYDMGHSKIYANNDISLKIGENEFVFIIGKSGSGKSTLLNMIGSLDYPTKGAVFLDGQNISHLDESELAQIRGKKIGFVFQSFNLINSMTALENVMLPMTFQNTDSKERMKNAKKILSLVDMSERLHNLPSELSGGERQRVAMARALANDPECVLLDNGDGVLDFNECGPPNSPPDGICFMDNIDCLEFADPDCAPTEGIRLVVECSSELSLKTRTNPKAINAGETKVFTALLEVKEGVPEGTYLCSVSVVGEDIRNVNKDLTVRVS